MEVEIQSKKVDFVNDSDEFTSDDLERLLALIEETDPFEGKIRSEF